MTGTFALALRATALRLLLPTVVLAAFGALVATRAQAPAEPTGVDWALGAATSRLWLQVPALILCAVTVAAVIEHWPLLTRDGSGTSFLRRLVPGPFDGGVTVTIAALCALTPALLLLALSFEHAARSAHPLSVRAVYAAEISGEGVLPPGEGEQRLTVSLPPVPLARLQLLPEVFLPPGGDLEPATLDLRLEARSLDAPRAVAARGLVEWPLGGARARELQIVRRAGPGPLLGFPPGSIRVQGARTHSPWANAAYAGLGFLIPTALALALLLALGRRLGRGPAQAVAIALLLWSSLAGTAPHGALVSSYARGSWIPAAGVPTGLFWSLSIGSLAMLAAAMTRGPRKR